MMTRCVLLAKLIHYEPSHLPCLGVQASLEFRDGFKKVKKKNVEQCLSASVKLQFVQITPIESVYRNILSCGVILIIIVLLFEFYCDIEKL